MWEPALWFMALEAATLALCYVNFSYIRVFDDNCVGYDIDYRLNYIDIDRVRHYISVSAAQHIKARGYYMYVPATKTLDVDSLDTLVIIRISGATVFSFITVMLVYVLTNGMR